MRKIAIFSFIIVCAIHFFFIKYDELSDYSIFNGKIIGFTDVNVTYPNYGYVKYQTNDVHVTRNIPIVEYVNRDNEKVVYEDGTRVLFSNFELNESVKVLENNKKNNYNVRIFFLFYYWCYIYHVIVIFMVSGILSVFIQVLLLIKVKHFLQRKLTHNLIVNIF